jgi:integrase
MKYTFRQILSRPDRTGRCRIVLDVAWESKREKLPTGVSCLPAHFNPNAVGRVVSIKDPDSARLNAMLAKVVASVTKAATLAVATDEPFEPPRKEKKPEAAARPQPKLPQEFYNLWLEESPPQGRNGLRRYKQVVAHLEAYQAGWELLTLTRRDFLEYVQHLARLDLVDSTVIKHVQFLRECFRLADRPVPSWLKLQAQVRYGRSPALQARELRQLIALPLDDAQRLQTERDMFLLQTMLLLRDSDLRQLRPHHVDEVELPTVGRVLVMSIRQVKTGDEVRLPLPPLAADIWRRYEGHLPVLAQQHRNRQMKQLMEHAGLTRPFVRVHYRQGTSSEEVVPLWQVITTHTARHTGADMVMLGSGGDSHLKEKALGHAGVYGHDALERYGPLLLAAWQEVLGATEKNAPK